MGNETPGLRQAGGSPIATVSPTTTTLPAQQSGGSQPLAHAASQSSSTPVWGLKKLAHSGHRQCQKAIRIVVKDLQCYCETENPVDKTKAESLLKEGLELQRAADFASQGKAKVWALRVLSWIGSVVTLGALPGLAKIFAPRGEFADSLWRYLLGSKEPEPEKLQQFEQLFTKLGELNDLAAKQAKLEEQLKEAIAVPPCLQGAAETLNAIVVTIASKNHRADNREDFNAMVDIQRRLFSLEGSFHGLPNNIDQYNVISGKIKDFESRFNELKCETDKEKRLSKASALSQELTNLEGEIKRSSEYKEARNKIKEFSRPVGDNENAIASIAEEISSSLAAMGRGIEKETEGIWPDEPPPM